MRATSRRMHYSYAEYLALEEHSDVRHEYLDGEIYAMAGGTADHAALAVAVLSEIRLRLPGSCRSHSSDLRIRIAATGLSTYPDGSVICGGARHAEDDAHAAVDPTILIEVTSNSSEDYDRGEKLRHYKTIDTLREVVILSHREPRVWVHQRGEDGAWSESQGVAGQTVQLRSIAATVSVDDLYRDGLDDQNRS